MAAQSLTIAGIQLQLVRSRRKTLSIEIKPEGALIRAPLRMRQNDIEAFVAAKRSWILKHLESRPKPLQNWNIQDGLQIPLQDNLLTLGINRQTRADEKVLNLQVRKTQLEFEQSCRNKLLRWYKVQAQEFFCQACREWGEVMNVKSSQRSNIKVRDYKRRWGSYDGKKTVSFNWRLIMAPQFVGHYVVIHELAHCYEFNHSPRFWRIVESYCPDWRTARDWLHANSTSLYRI